MGGLIAMELKIKRIISEDLVKQLLSAETRRFASTCYKRIEK